MSDWLKYTE